MRQCPRPRLRHRRVCGHLGHRPQQSATADQASASTTG
jgi:hypothetical protein